VALSEEDIHLMYMPGKQEKSGREKRGGPIFEEDQRKEKKAVKWKPVYLQGAQKALGWEEREKKSTRRKEKKKRAAPRKELTGRKKKKHTSIHLNLTIRIAT